MFSQTDDSDSKLSGILELMASQLMMNCSCYLTAKYIAQANLTCDGGIAVLQGALIGTQEKSSAELHRQLQNWVDAGQRIQIMRVTLEVVSCSTYPGFEETCKRVTFLPTSPSTPIIDTADVTTPASALGGVSLYVVLAGSMALAIAAATIVVIVACRRRCRNQKYETNRLGLVLHAGNSSSVSRLYWDVCHVSVMCQPW